MKASVMKTMNARPVNSQRGSIYTTLILVALFAMVILAALKVVPAYIDDNTVTTTMNGMVERKELGEMSIAEIRSSLMRTLNTNRIIDFEASNVNLVREDGKEFIDINYETRKPLFYNIEAVVVFKHRYEKL